MLLKFIKLLCANTPLFNIGTRDIEMRFRTEDDSLYTCYYRMSILNKPIELGIKTKKMITPKLSYHIKGAMIYILS